ncbi:MAG: hypothetical protein GXY74_01910 [Phycisphaerae bacterium]|nr:hypothetical protein [Phycisphaerae bacterium]
MKRNCFAWATCLALIAAMAAGAAAERPLDNLPVYTKANAPKTPSLEELPLKESVSQYGITWTFDKPARVGQFITGDWYVVGEVTVRMIDPKPLWGDEVKTVIPKKEFIDEAAHPGKYARNGSVLNMPANNEAGFDSRIPAERYDPSQFAHLPIAMKPGDTLISTVSIEPLTRFDVHARVLAKAAILTCVASPQPADAFRPSYCDRGQTIYLARNLHRELLQNLPQPKSVPALEGQLNTQPVAKDGSILDKWVAVTIMPWLDTVEFGFASPEINQPHYGQWHGAASSTIGLMLHLDYPAQEKERLLVCFIQRGIDLYGIARSGYEGWPGHGGHGSGRKWPIVFAGLMLDDKGMQNLKESCPKTKFGEDHQTAFGKCWSGGDVVFTSHPKGAKVSPELKSPEEAYGKDGWDIWESNEGYRRCCTSKYFVGEALAARIMRAEKVWNHDPFFAYVDRWMTEDNAKTVDSYRKAMESHGENFDDTSNPRTNKTWMKNDRRTTPFYQEMWDKYRNDLPPALAGNQGDKQSR